MDLFSLPTFADASQAVRKIVRWFPRVLIFSILIHASLAYSQAYIKHVYGWSGVLNGQTYRVYVDKSGGGGTIYFPSYSLLPPASAYSVGFIVDATQTGEYRLNITQEPSSPWNPYFKTILYNASDYYSINAGDTLLYTMGVVCPSTSGVGTPFMQIEVDQSAWPYLTYSKVGNQVYNLAVDADKPTSYVYQFSPQEQASTNINVRWTGDDGSPSSGASGIWKYDVQMRVDNGSWQNWIMGTTLTSASYTGTAGHTYYFQSRAYDNVGNMGNFAGGNGDAWVTILPKPTATTSYANKILATSATLYGDVNPNGSNTTCYFEYGVSTSYGNSTPLQTVGSGNSKVTVNAPITGLPPATAIHFRLAATNSAGTVYGNDIMFTTQIAAPELSSPADGETDVSVSPTVSWNASKGATSYHLQVAASPSFSPTVWDQSGYTPTNQNLFALQNDTKYYWHVSATGGGYTTPYSDTWSFTTKPASAGAPQLVYPSNSSEGIPTDTTFYWNASNGATSYHIQVSTNLTYTALVLDRSEITGTSQAVSGLANGMTYYWRVNATGPGGTGSYSPTDTFVTVVAAPSAPTLVYPSDQAIGIPLDTTLYWNASVGASSYHLQLSTTSSFSTTIFDTNGITETSKKLSALVNGTTYFWHVSASNAGGASAYSSIESFTTEPQTAVRRMDSPIPTAYALSQNYPNPFNPTTTIDFSIPKETFVRLTVYDPLGRQVKILIDNELTAGTYHVTLDASALQSGVYFYRLEAGNYSDTKKLVLLK